MATRLRRFFRATALPFAPSDNFNRADENPIAAPWINDTFWGGVRIVGNEAYSVDGDSGVAYWPIQPNANQFAAGVIGTSDIVSGICCRYQPTVGTAYFLFSDTTALQCYRYNAGVGTLLANEVVAAWVPNTSSMRLEVTGVGATVTVRIYKDGAQVGADISDSDANRIVLPGYVGVHGFGTNGLTSWSAGNL